MTENTPTTAPAPEVLKLPQGIRSYACFKDDETKKETHIPLVPKKIKRGDWVDVQYPAFKDIENMQELSTAVAAFGEDRIFGFVNDKLNQLCIQAFYQASDSEPESAPGKDDGAYISTDWEKYLKSLEEGRVSGDTLDDLNERKEKLGAELEALFEKLDPTQAKPEEMVKALARGKAVKKEIHAINTQILQRKEDFSRRRNAKKIKAAEEAKAAGVAA